jgi:hypothetical protein
LAEHVARRGGKRNSYKTVVKMTKGGYYLRDISVDERIILKWILGK